MPPVLRPPPPCQAHINFGVSLFPVFNACLMSTVITQWKSTKSALDKNTNVQTLCKFGHFISKQALVIGGQTIRSCALESPPYSPAQSDGACKLFNSAQTCRE